MFPSVSQAQGVHRKHPQKKKPQTALLRLDQIGVENQNVAELGGGKHVNKSFKPSHRQFLVVNMTGL